MKTRHLFDQPCRHCGGSGWEVTQWPGNPPERDGCRHCSGGVVPGLITRGRKRLELWALRLRRFARRQLRRLPWRRRREIARQVAAIATPQIPEPVAPLPLRLAVDAARRSFPEPTFRLLYSPAQDLWAIVIEHGRKRAQKMISPAVIRDFPPNLIEREAFKLCRQGAYELDPSFARPASSQELELRRQLEHAHLPTLPCKARPDCRGGVYSVRDVGPLRDMLDRAIEEHSPDGLLSPDPYTTLEDGGNLT